MADSSQGKRILIGVDHSDSSEKAFRTIIENGTPDDRIFVYHSEQMNFHFIPSVNDVIIQQDEENCQISNNVVQRYQELCQQAGRQCEFIKDSHIGGGTEIGQRICETATKIGVDEVYVGHSGSRTWLSGSVGETVLKTCFSDVAIVKK